MHGARLGYKNPHLSRAPQSTSLTAKGLRVLGVKWCGI